MRARPRFSPSGGFRFTTTSPHSIIHTQLQINSVCYVENIARIANAVPFTLNSRVTMNDEIVVLNCQKCNQCLTGHKSRIIHSGCFLNVIVLIVFIVLTVPQKIQKIQTFRSGLLITLIKCLKGHKFLRLPFEGVL